jgi:hypothetical protein
MFHVEHIVTMTMTGNIVKTDKNKKTRNKYGLASRGDLGGFAFCSHFVRVANEWNLHSPSSVQLSHPEGRDVPTTCGKAPASAENAEG